MSAAGVFWVIYLNFRLRISGAAAALALAMPSPALAASTETIPPECGSRAELELELERRLGSQVSLAETEVTIWSETPRYRLRVRVGSDQRELTDENCRALFRAAIVVAVAMLVPDKREPPADLEKAPPKSSRDSDARNTRGAPSVAMAAGVGISLGLLPAPVLALELEAKLMWQHWGLAADARYLSPGSTRDAENRGVTIQAVGGGLHALWRPARPWEARLGFSAYGLFGKGLGSEGTEVDSEGAAWAGGPVLGMAFIPLHLPPFWGAIAADAQINVLRGRFEILSYREVFRVPLLSGSGLLKLGVLW